MNRTAVAVALLALARPADAETKRHREELLPADITRLIALHASGDCIVRPLPAGEKPRVIFDSVATGKTIGEEVKFLDGVRLTIESAGGTATVRTLYPPDSAKPEQLSYAATMTLLLPRAWAVEIENRFGRIVVDDRDADVRAQNHGRGVEISRVRGDVRVGNEFDVVVVHDCARDVRVTAKHCEVVLERIGGLAYARTTSLPVRIDHAGSADVETMLSSVTVAHVEHDARIVAPFGAVSATGIGGSLSIDSGNENVTVADVGGDVTIQHKKGTIDARRIRGKATVSGNLSDTTLEEVGGAVDVRCPNSLVRIVRTGEVKAQTSARTLEIVDPRAGVDASGSGGRVRLRATLLPADDAAHEITLVANGGALELELPETGSYALDATSTSGQIECSLAGMETTLQGSARVGTLVRGDPKSTKVKLHATCVGGAIRVAPAGAK